jgi:hypothetical protein
VDDFYWKERLIICSTNIVLLAKKFICTPNMGTIVTWGALLIYLLYLWMKNPTRTVVNVTVANVFHQGLCPNFITMVTKLQSLSTDYKKLQSQHG